MAYKFGGALSESYSEVGQNNPLRWCIVYEEENGILSPQSGWVKCKDFFNDLVAACNGNGFSIYGFNSAKMKVNDGFVGMVLKECVPEFMDNVKRTGVISVGEFFPLGKGMVYVKFSKDKTFKTAFDISLASYAIRLCNTTKVLNNWAELFSQENIKFDCPVNQETIAWVKEKGFAAIPDSLRKYPIAVVTAGGVVNAVKSSSSTIHNNGIQAYYFHTKQLGAL